MTMELHLLFPLWIYIGYSIFYWGLKGNFIKVHLSSRQHMRSSLPGLVRCCVQLCCCTGRRTGKKSPLTCMTGRDIVLSETLTKPWQNALAVWILRTAYPTCSPWRAERALEEGLGVFAQFCHDEVLPWPQSWSAYMLCQIWARSE